MKRTTKILLSSLVFLFVMITAIIIYLSHLEKQYRKETGNNAEKEIYCNCFDSELVLSHPEIALH